MTATDLNATALEIDFPQFLEPSSLSTDSGIWRGTREALGLSSSQRVVLRTDPRDVAATHQMARESASSMKAIEWQCVFAQEADIVASDLPTSPTFLTQQLRVERTQFDFVAAESLRSDGAHKDFLKLAALFSSPAIFGLGIDTPADEAIGGYA
jgi:hypothetical protein